MDGWVKLHRKLKDWEWYGIPEMVTLFVELLLSANYEDKEWRGIILKRGQLTTGRKELADATGLSQQTVRTCLKRMEATNEITIKSTNKFSVITLINWEDYNGDNDEVTSKSTSKSTSKNTDDGQPENHQPANHQLRGAPDLANIVSPSWDQPLYKETKNNNNTDSVCITEPQYAEATQNEHTQIFQELELQEEYKLIAKHAGVYQKNLERCWKKFKAYYQASPPPPMELPGRWEKWCLDENQKPLAEEENIRILTEDEKLIHRVGIANWHRKEGRYQPPANLKELQAYEAENGRVTWDGLQGWEKLYGKKIA